jgi:hypothetical protein
MKTGKKLAKIALEAVDLEKLAFGIIDEVVEEAIDKVVADSTNTYDDMLKAVLWPLIEKEVKQIISKKVQELKDSVVAE